LYICLCWLNRWQVYKMQHDFTEQSLLNAMPIAAAIFTGNQHIIKAANQMMLNLWAKSNSVIGKNFHDGIPELKNQPFFDLISNIYQTGEPFHDPDGMAMLMVNNQLQAVYFDYWLKPVKNEDGHVIAIVNTAIDTTAEVLERQLRERAEEQLDFTLDAAGVGTWQLDLAHRQVLWNEKCKLLYGFTGADVVPYQKVIDLIHPDDSPVVKRAVLKALNPALGGSYDIKFRTVDTTNNQLHWLHCKGMAYFDAEQQPYRFSGIAMDVTAEVENQQRVQDTLEELQVVNEELQSTVEELAITNHELETSNEQLSAAREAAQIGLFDWDLINQKYSWDARSKQLFGFDADDTPKHYNDLFDRLHPDDRKKVNKAVENARNRELTGGRYDIEYRVINGGDIPVRWIRALGRMLFNDEGIPVRFIGTLMDITDQVTNRQQLESSEERLRLAVESANLGTWFINAQTMQLIPSARLKEMFGYYPDEEMSYEAAIKQIADEHRDRVLRAVEAAISNGESYNLEYPIVGYHDGKTRWLRATGKLYAAENNEAPTFSGTVTDITEEKQNEQRKNDFISMVSHELKTPLTSTISYVQVSERKALANQDVISANMLGRAGKQLGKMTRLINGFLNVSRLEAGKIQIDRQRFDLAVLIKEVEENVMQDATSHKVIFAPVDETWVNVDKDKIEQVINNFISNAVKYSPPYTTIQVACVTHHNHAYVSVTDEGMGIRSEDQARLFDRFYRVEGQETKSISGFGIGLYLCKEIIDRHDGKIGVESEPKQGSKFWFALPLFM